MGFDVQKVDQTRCEKCGLEMDVRGHKPLTAMLCPKCGSKVYVPVKMGTMLLLRLLGEGSSGMVYEGRDTLLNRPVAVKIIKPDASKTDEQARELLSEARALAAVNHPNVIRVHNVGEFRGQSYIEMELLRGRHVREMVDAPERVGEARSIEIIRDAARGLRAALAVGLVHRDIKPANILIAEDGTAKLVDFGVARFRKQQAEKLVVGTPYYVAPEIVRQRDADFRADIYSLGCTLFHLLTGKPPFDAPTVTGVYMARLKQKPAPLRQVDPTIHAETAAVVDRMLQRQPEDRHASYDELIADLEWALAAVNAGPQQLDAPSNRALVDAAKAARSAEPPSAKSLIPAAKTRRLRTVGRSTTKGKKKPKRAPAATTKYRPRPGLSRSVILMFLALVLILTALAAFGWYLLTTVNHRGAP